MKYRSILALITSLVITGCAGYLYEQGQRNGQQECQKLPTYSQYKSCMEKYELSYKEYEQEREELLKE